MGSSKRSHKDKKRVKRSRSRSGSRERHERKSRKESRAEERVSPVSEPEEGEITDRDPDEAQGNDISLSIEETNKLRAKLGLKPLDDGSSTQADDDSYEKRPEVFVKTENISDKIHVEKVKERIALTQEKRKYIEKLRSVKTLADSDSDDDVDDWVAKSRELEKLKAEQKARELEELDREIESSVQNREERHYRSKDLTGLTVAHSSDAVKEGSLMVLTLKDKELLAEENADVLENVNLVDEEKAAENVLNRKRGIRDYNPYDLGEDGEGKGMLSKYDETIAGKKQETFTIGRDSLQDIREKVKALQQAGDGKVMFSLEDTGIKGFASEFYTQEEMLQFKKPKKVRKKQSLRQRNLTEELEPIPTATSTSDQGSRSKKRKTETSSPEPNSSNHNSAVEKKELKIDASLILQKMEVDEPDDEDLSGIVIEDDEAERELREALEKARKLKENAKSEESKIAELAQKIKQETDETSTSESSAVFFNATNEFCRNLGVISSYAAAVPSSSRDSDDEEEAIIRKRQEKKDVRIVSSKKVRSEPHRSDWRQVDLEAEGEEVSYSKPSTTERKTPILKSEPILGEEPDVSQGVAAALKLAMNKGYLDKEMTKSAPQKKAIEAVNYTIEEKFYDDDKNRGRDRYAGSSSEFREKSGYKPDVKLEYVDDLGRVLNQKEAFRVLSHKFHGKGPGKNKIDKREQKLRQESKLMKMSSDDTPLHTVKKLQEKQKELAQPYVVLSGAGAHLTKK